jgi:ankyrin repeat protein
MQGHAGVVEQLLGAGATVDCVTEEGMTPLHCTVHVRNCMQAEESTPCMKNVMRLLIESSAPFSLPLLPLTPAALEMEK